MTTAGRGQVWTGEQLSARLAALGGAAPEITHYAVYWAIAGAAVPGRLTDRYWLPEKMECLAPASFDFWLAQRGVAGAGRLAVAVLVVRAALTPLGEIDTCTLEYRRGAADGPFHGSPARITFSGPAQDVRFHQALPDGRLAEIAPTPGLRAPLDQGSEAGDAGEGASPAALAAWFGAPVRVTGARAPTVIEAMVGIARVLHLERPGGAETGCGILWHGPIAVPLPAAFPRFDAAPPLAPAQQAALAALQVAERLLLGETRRDDRGLAVLARRQATHEPVLIRFEGELPRIVPYAPGLPPGITEAQMQWVRYIETYEHLRVRDGYRDGDTGALIVVTDGADEKSWRHSVDDDGVETWRTMEAAEAQPAAPPSAAPAPGNGRSAETRAAGTWAAGRGAAGRGAAGRGAAGRGAAAARALAMRPGVAPFGDLVDRRFPGAAYDIDEAVRCLAQGRSTAAVFHAMRIITHGLDAYAAWRGEPNPPIQRGEHRWRVLLRWMRDDAASRELHALLDGVRAAWRGAALQVGSKYTEAEARQIMLQVERFISGLAALCDGAGVPASELDDDV